MIDQAKKIALIEHIPVEHLRKYKRCVALRTDQSYSKPMFTAVFQKSGEWWAAYLEEVPGVNSQGPTVEEARENLREALAMVLEANRELARRDEPPDCIREKLAFTT